MFELVDSEVFLLVASTSGCKHRIPPTPMMSDPGEARPAFSWCPTTRCIFSVERTIGTARRVTIDADQASRFRHSTISSTRSRDRWRPNKAPCILLLSPLDFKRRSETRVFVSWCGRSPAQDILYTAPDFFFISLTASCLSEHGPETSSRRRLEAIAAAKDKR